MGTDAGNHAVKDNAPDCYQTEQNLVVKLDGIPIYLVDQILHTTSASADFALTGQDSDNECRNFKQKPCDKPEKKPLAGPGHFAGFPHQSFRIPAQPHIRILYHPI
jgi:hypothetical protein